MANEYPQFPSTDNQGENRNQNGGAQGSESFGPAFGPFDAGTTAQQPTRVNAPGQAGHFASNGAQSTYQAQGGTYPYATPAQDAYRQQGGQPQGAYPQGQQGYGYQQAQQAPQTQVRQQPYAGYAYQQNAQAQAQAQARQAQGPQNPQGPQLHREPPRDGVRVTAERKQHTGLKAVACGLLGGVLGSAGLVWALSATGNLGKTTVITQDGATGQAISIATNSEDVTTSEAVAAKCLPSVCPVYVQTPSGTGMGSGVILDTDGNILTNYHVAGDAQAIEVTIGGKSYEATLVGGDASSDLAVVHAELGGDAVTPIEIGDSSALVVGDWVMTIGSPLGLEQSVSSGIVSSLSRNTMQTSTGEGVTLYANLIQTDAVINPGNSGGALVNEEGQLVGIPTLFSSDTGNYAGVGYAIPGNYAIDIANKIISGEQVTHAYIGLSMQTVNAQNAAANKLSVNQGAYVAKVTEGGPAAQAGIQEGDIIIKLGDSDITSADDALLAVRSHSIGETVSVTVMRGKEEMKFDITLSSDEQLQEQQKQLLEEQQRQQQEYYDQLQQYQQQNGNGWGNGFGNGNGYGNGYSDQEMLEQLYEYLYNNR